MEEKNLSTGTVPFPLMYGLSIADPAADFGDPHEARIDHDPSQIDYLAKTRFRGDR